MGIATELLHRLHTVLLRCGPFYSDGALRATFADERISSWQNKIPHAESPEERVNKLIDFLFNQSNQQGQNALGLLLRVLAENVDSTDACHQDLCTLAQEVEAALPFDGARDHLTPRPYPSSIAQQSPPLPEHFVARPDIATDLEKRLLSQDERPGVLPISVLHGPGGAGKSTLASALAHNSTVRQRFPDGVLWTFLGQQPQVLSELIKLIRELEAPGFNPVDVDTASSRLRSLLDSKAILLVIDDVWDPDDVLPFKVGGNRCHLLITTRRAIVAEELRAHVYEVGQMSSGQALALLSEHLKRPLEKAERLSAEQYTERVGYLPQALELGAVQIKKGKSWSALLNVFEEEIARLEALEDPRHADRRDRSLLACINLSLNALRKEDEDAWRSFARLGLLPKGAEVAAPAAATLWDIDEESSLERLELLHNESLLLPPRETRIGEQKYRTYRVQDILHDMARRVFTAASPDGLGLTFSEGHTRLLERYQAQTQNVQWHTLPDDGYIYEHLLYHLEQAEQIEDLLTLFSTPAWMRKRHRQMLGYHAYMEEVWHAQRIFEGRNVAGLPERIVLSYLEWQVRSIYKELPPNLLELYIALGEGWETRVIPSAQLMPKLSQSIDYLSGVGAKLIAQGHIDEARPIVHAAVEIYLESSEADFDELFVRKGVGFALVGAIARTGGVELCDRLLDSLYIQYQRLSEEEDISNYFIDESLKAAAEALGQAGTAEEAYELIEKYLSRWPATNKLWYFKERNKLLEACIRQLIQNSHYHAAENLLAKLQDTEIANKLWTKHLDDLGWEYHRRDTWQRIQNTPSAGILEQKCIEHGLSDLWQRVISPKEDTRLLRSWIETRYRAAMWQRDFNAAKDYLVQWNELNAGKEVRPPETIEWRVFQRMRDPTQISGRSPMLAYGTWSDSLESLLWLAILGEFNLLTQVAQSEIRRYWRVVSDGDEIIPLPLLSKVHSIEDLQTWLSALPLPSSSSWDRDAQSRTKLTGARYLAFKLAKQGQVSEAQRVIALFEKEGREFNEMIHLSIGQGIALQSGIEEGRGYIREHCSGKEGWGRGLMDVDHAADLWAVARALLMFDEHEEAWQLMLTDTYEHPGRNDAWVDLAGWFSTHLWPDEFAARLSKLDYKTAVDIVGRLTVVDAQYASQVLDVITANRTTEPTWGEGLKTKVWPVDMSDDPLFERYNIRQASLEQKLNREVDAAALRRVLIAVGLRDDIDNFLYYIDLEDVEFLILCHRGHQFAIGRNRLTAICEYSRDELSTSWNLIDVMEKAGVSDNALPNWFVMRLLFCVTWSWLFDDLYRSQLQTLTQQLEADLNLGRDPSVWFLLPPALAGIGQVKQARKIAEQLIDSFGVQWISDMSSRPVATLSDESQHIAQTLYRYSLAQICLVMPAGKQQKTLLRNLVSICPDLNFLMQLLVYYVQQHAEKSLIRLLINAICHLAAQVTLSYHSGSVASSVEDPVAVHTALNDLEPPLTTRYWDCSLTYELEELDSITGEEEHHTYINESSFLLLCIELLLAERADLVQHILNAFQKPGNVIETVSEIIRLSPWSLDGMLLALDKLNRLKKPLQCDEWPHKVLLGAITEVTDAESFIRLIDTTRKLIDDTDILVCYRMFVDQLKPAAFRAVLEGLLEQDAQQIEDLHRAILLSNFLRILIEKSNQFESTLNPVELTKRACDLMEKYKTQAEPHRRVYPWGYRRNMYSWYGLFISPLSAYSLGMAALSHNFADAGLQEEAQQAKIKALRALYGELQRAERWSESDFEKVLYIILNELGGEELTARVVDIFRRCKWPVRIPGR